MTQTRVYHHVFYGNLKIPSSNGDLKAKGLLRAALRASGILFASALACFNHPFNFQQSGRVAEEFEFLEELLSDVQLYDAKQPGKR